LTGFDVLNGSGASKSASTAESCIRCRALDIGVSEAVGAGALGVVGLAGASGAVAISAIIISLSQLAVVIIESLALRGLVRRGLAWRSSAGPGVAMFGAAWQGVVAVFFGRRLFISSRVVNCAMSSV